MKVTKVPIVGAISAEGPSGGADEDYVVHILTDGGTSATATARVIRIKMNSSLTED